MIHLCVAITLIASPQDSVSKSEMMQHKYSRQVLVNSILGFSCAIGMGIFHTKGNDAYEDYRNSQSISTAVEAWDRVQINDTARNIFAVGAALFLGRAIYYQVKRANITKSASLVPVIEMCCSNQPRIKIGLQKNL